MTVDLINIISGWVLDNRLGQVTPNMITELVIVIVDAIGEDCPEGFPYCLREP